MSAADNDLERRLRRLAAQADGLRLPSGPDVRATGDRRLRRRRRLAVTVAGTVVVAGGVGLGVLWPKAPVPRVPVSTRPRVTVTTSPGTAGTTVPVTTSPAVANSLRAYLGAQAAEATAAADRAGQSGSIITVSSGPVEDDGTIVAVAAFSYSATGHPVQVLSYSSGRWSAVATLGAELGAPVQPLGNPDLFALDPGATVSVADVTGDGHPDFLIRVEAGDNIPGVVVSQDGGRWRFVPASGPYGTSDVVSRNPQFHDGTLVSTDDSCVPDCASGAEYTLSWTYRPSAGDFFAPPPPGTTAPVGAQ